MDLKYFITRKMLGSIVQRVLANLNAGSLHMTIQYRNSRVLPFSHSRVLS